MNANASETVGDLTGFVNVQLNMDTLNAANTFSTDGVHAGISGDFGTFKMGKVDDVNFGRYGNDIEGEGIGNGAALGYTNTFGAVNFGAFYSPAGNSDEIALGASTAFGPVSVGASFSSTDATDKVLFGAEAGLGAVTLGAHMYTEETGAAEKEVVAVKASGSAAAWSWGVTYAMNKDVQDHIRLDLGSSVAGLDLGIRYDSVSPEAGGSTDTAYVQLGKSF